jgi:hypothetical protein
MSPLPRVVIAGVSIGGVRLLGWLALRAAAENITAMRPWRRGWLWQPDGAFVMAFPTVDRDGYDTRAAAKK